MNTLIPVLQRVSLFRKGEGYAVHARNAQAFMWWQGVEGMSFFVCRKVFKILKRANSLATISANDLVVCRNISYQCYRSLWEEKEG